jgi:hypothetical protein
MRNYESASATIRATLLTQPPGRPYSIRGESP